jgi:hypothetical protein
MGLNIYLSIEQFDVVELIFERFHELEGYFAAFGASFLAITQQAHLKHLGSKVCQCFNQDEELPVLVQAQPFNDSIRPHHILHHENCTFDFAFR